MSSNTIIRYFKRVAGPEDKAQEVGYRLSAQGYSVDAFARVVCVNSAKNAKRLVTQSEAHNLIDSLSSELQSEVTEESVKGCARIDIVYETV
ncbi:hypothetical protein [Vibrio sp. TRT 29B02]|uniref:hypothetical protein n=1 Tax=Vibrio sp. TRT 29B02 TaxID=3418508 RepID=UPI003CEE26B9